MRRILRLATLLPLAAAAPAGAQEYVSVGSTVTGELAPGDATDGDGKHADVWLFPAVEGATYVITLLSTDFDAFLEVGPRDGDGCGPCVRDDDGLSGTDARVRLRAGSREPHAVRVTSYDAGETGRYTLKVRGYAPPAIADPLEGLSTDTLVVAEPEPAADDSGAVPAHLPVLPGGIVARGTLEHGDRLGPDTTYLDVWRFDAQGHETVTFTLSSGELDPVLRVGRWWNGRWEELGSDDDGAGGTDSRLTLTFQDPGEYEVHARAFSPAHTGGYLLLATVAGSPEDVMMTTDTVLTPEAWDTVTTIPLTDAEWALLEAAELPIVSPGGRVDAALAAGDAVGEDGAYYDAYRYFASAGETATFRLASEDFDAVLRVGTREDGRWREVASDDDGGDGTDSEITITFRAGAEYEIRAGAFAEGSTGAYTLSATTDVHAETDGMVPPGMVVPGQTVTGRLELSDERGDGGAFVDAWTTIGGGSLTIELRSDDFDTLLRVLAQRPDGSWEEVASDDDGGVGTGSRLTVELPAGGRYRVHATAYRDGDRGEYRLSVRY